MKASTRPANVEWINYKLSGEDAMRFGSWDAEKDEVQDMVGKMIADGYRLSFSYDSYNKALQCSVICGAVDGPNAGKGMSTFAHEFGKLVEVVVWKHFILFNETWPSGVIPGVRPDFG